MTIMNLTIWTQHEKEDRDIIIENSSVLDENSPEARKVCNAISAVTMLGKPAFPSDALASASKPNVTIYSKGSELVIELVPKKADSNVKRKNPVSIHVNDKNWFKVSDLVLPMWIMKLSDAIVRDTEQLIDRSYDAETLYELCVGITLIYASKHKKRWLVGGIPLILLAAVAPFLITRFISMEKLLPILCINNLIIMLIFVVLYWPMSPRLSTIH